MKYSKNKGATTYAKNSSFHTSSFGRTRPAAAESDAVGKVVAASDLSVESVVLLAATLSKSSKAPANLFQNRVILATQII